MPRLQDAANKWKFKDFAVEAVPNVAEVLMKAQNAATTNGEVLDNCHSWFNLGQLALAKIPDARRIRLETPRATEPGPNTAGIEKKNKK